jgi:hypothetical protein
MNISFSISKYANGIVNSLPGIYQVLSFDKRDANNNFYIFPEICGKLLANRIIRSDVK